MFRLIYRKTKEAPIFCVRANRTKHNLLSIIKENVDTNEDEEDNLSELDMAKTRIYFDCFSSYRVDDFKRLSYILKKKVNYSILLRYRMFHANAV